MRSDDTIRVTDSMVGAVTDTLKKEMDNLREEVHMKSRRIADLEKKLSGTEEELSKLEARLNFSDEAEDDRINFTTRIKEGKSFHLQSLYDEVCEFQMFYAKLL